jgi:hypothetical protein
VITLVDVAALCARMRAVELDLFEQLGRWVTATPPGVEQRRWATLCHRHAWHADLWAGRAPAIRAFDLDAAVAAQRGTLGEPGDRAAWYGEVLAVLRSELAEAAARIDAELDPSTARTVALVAADLDAAG